MKRLLLFVFALAPVGCGQSEPEQPKLSDEKIQEIMKEGKATYAKEAGTRGANNAGR